MRVKQRDVFLSLVAIPEHLADYNAVVHLANTSFFSSLIVLENNKIFKLIVPNWKCDCAAGITNTALTARTQICKPFLKERD